MKKHKRRPLSRRETIQLLSILLVGVVGGLLAMKSPLYLAPPLIHWTRVVYLLLILAWIPLMAVFMWRNGFRPSLGLVILPCIMLTVMGGMSLAERFDLLPEQCSRFELEDNTVRYICDPKAPPVASAEEVDSTVDSYYFHAHASSIDMESPPCTAGIYDGFNGVPLLWTVRDTYRVWVFICDFEIYDPF